MSQEADVASTLPTPLETPPLEKRIRLPEVKPAPEVLYRVQRSAALDARGVEHFPASATQDHKMLGVNAAYLRPMLSFEQRVNKTNVERALDPANTVATGLIALYADKDKALADFEFFHSVGCADVYIIHIATDALARGMLNMMARPHGEAEDRRIALPVLGLESPSLFIFPVVAVMDIFQIHAASCPKDVWFAADSIPAQYVVRREARRIAGDWSGRDERWNRWNGLEHLEGRRSMNELGVVNEPPTPMARRSPSLEALRSPGLEPLQSPSLLASHSSTPGASEAGTGLDSGSSATEGGDGGAGLVAGEAGGSSLGGGVDDESPETLGETPDTVKSSPTLVMPSPTMGEWLRDPIEGSH